MYIDFFFPESTRSDEDRRQRADDPRRDAHVTSSYLRFGYDYFDNPELVIGYGGYKYDGRYKPAAENMCRYYGLVPGNSVLEIGCAKGFVLTEFRNLGMNVTGSDLSAYALQHISPDLQSRAVRSDVVSLPFSNLQFDLVLAKEVLPHVPESFVARAVLECMRVSKKAIFIEIQTGRTERELEYLRKWDATHLTLRPPEWWDTIFSTVGYHGDVHYKILIPENRA